ncbi:hypothetical protein, partial [Staphylococcus felis]|uniref:hypothetical protein n=1 Tax=Staphylococcus felis TaxID=46127 RepID=UPI000E3654A0
MCSGRSVTFHQNNGKVTEEPPADGYPGTSLDMPGEGTIPDGSADQKTRNVRVGTNGAAAKTPGYNG